MGDAKPFDADDIAMMRASTHFMNGSDQRWLATFDAERARHAQALAEKTAEVERMRQERDHYRVLSFGAPVLSEGTASVIRAHFARPESPGVEAKRLAEHEMWRCGHCGDDVEVSEQECCVHCGRDCVVAIRDASSPAVEVREGPPKSFTAHRGPPENVGEHIELHPTELVRSRSGAKVSAFCLPLAEARELGEELIRLAAPPIRPAEVREGEK